MSRKLFSETAPDSNMGQIEMRTVSMGNEFDTNPPPAPTNTSVLKESFSKKLCKVSAFAGATIVGLGLLTNGIVFIAQASTLDKCCAYSSKEYNDYKREYYTLGVAQTVTGIGMLTWTMCLLYRECKPQNAQQNTDHDHDVHYIKMNDEDEMNNKKMNNN